MFSSTSPANELIEKLNAAARRVSKRFILLIVYYFLN
jgi:hypothetical protein